MTPIVSVIMPVYNGSAYIGKAIESALLQGVPLEIIVIDDGSTDNLDDVLKKYADTDVIRVIHNKHNIGVARSLQRVNILHFWIVMTGGSRENLKHSFI